MKVKIQGKKATTKDALTTANDSSKDLAQHVQQNQLEKPQVKSKPLDPTRYGDWEKKGRCIDF